MTKRKKIATTFVTELSALSIAGGYKVDFPTAKHWAVNVIPKEKETTVIIRDTLSRDFESEENSTEKLNIEILLGVCIEDENYDTIDAMVDDIKKWHSNNHHRIEEELNLLQIKYVSDELGVDQLEKQIGVAKVLFEVATGQHCNWIYDDTEY